MGKFDEITVLKESAGVLLAGGVRVGFVMLVYAMPTLSTFYGILIQMFWLDHGPPHFHALYAEHEVLIDIRTLEIIQGSMPRRALALVLEWAQEHRTELMEDWELCSHKQSPKKIEPLR